MNYADIKCNDAANGPGVRISLFVSGCTHHCKGCFNEVTWDFNYGNPFTQKEIDMIIKDLEPPYISGLTILGGEPMEPANQPGILPLIRKVREVYGSGKTIWIYSGYLFDRDILGRMVNEIPETKEILSGIDVLMDGPYVEELKIYPHISVVQATRGLLMFPPPFKTAVILLSGNLSNHSITTLLNSYTYYGGKEHDNN